MLLDVISLLLVVSLTGEEPQEFYYSVTFVCVYLAMLSLMQHTLVLLVALVFDLSTRWHTLAHALTNGHRFAGLT